MGNPNVYMFSTRIILALGGPLFWALWVVSYFTPDFLIDLLESNYSLNSFESYLFAELACCTHYVCPLTQHASVPLSQLIVGNIIFFILSKEGDPTELLHCDEMNT